MYERYGKPPDVSFDALVKKYASWVYTCININSIAYASVPLRLYATRATGQSRAKFPAVPVSKDMDKFLRDKSSLQSLARLKTAEDVEEIIEHPALTLLKNVNQFENSFELKELTNTMLDLTGNCFWFIPNGKLGIPEQMWLLRSQWTKIIPDKKTFIKGYLYGRRFDQLVRLEPDEVIHFKYPNPHDPYYGLGPVQASAPAVQRQDMMDRFESSTLENMGRPDIGIVYQKGRLSAPKRKELEEEWNTAFKGPDRAGKIKIMDSEFKVERFGWSPKEMEFLKGRPWTMKEIASSLNVPVGFLDTSEISKAPRAGMEGTDLSLAKYSTRPRCLRIEQKLNEKLAPRYDERLFFAFDNPVPADERFDLLQETADLKNYKISINEARAADGLPPVAWGDTPLLSNTIVPLGSAVPSEESNNPIAPKPKPKPKKSDKVVQEDACWDGLSSGETFDGRKLHPDLAGVGVEVR